MVNHHQNQQNKSLPTQRIEKLLQKKGYKYIAGVDEAGRGCLAGPVVAAAVILKNDIKGLDDSKRLTPEQREEFFKKIKQNMLTMGIGIVNSKIIDKLNILQATILAMKKSVARLKIKPDFLLIDGNITINCGIPYRAIINGDRKSKSIAAASIVAKVTRDKLMQRYEKLHPGFNFSKNKGYLTKAHLESLKQYGLSSIHRKTFSPCSKFV